ncbi:MAG: tetratricopeptide repeat protein [Treponema sp.]|nr:tetratricopeptide repeat protein [Treponema sp.]
MEEKRLIFLPVPGNLREKLQNKTQQTFTIDSDIPIPVEVEINENLSPENISMEMILCGMLRAIEMQDVKKEWMDYYSNFILFLRPDIINLLNDIKDNISKNETLIPSSRRRENPEKSISDSAQAHLAHKLILDGKAEESLTVIREFLEHHPQMPGGWFLLGWALRQLGRWADGEAALRKAIELGGDNSDARNELAICLMETGNIKGAKRELETALTADSENTKLISNLGVLALKTGNREEASGFFRTALEIDKNDPVAKDFFAKEFSRT